MSAIRIPVKGSEEVVEVPISEIAELDPNDVIDILQAEVASLDLWLRFAIEYYKQGRSDAFQALLEPLVELHNQPSQLVGTPNVLHEQFGNDKTVKQQFLEILNALAAFHAANGSRTRDKAARKAEFDQAKKYYDSAETVDVLSSSNFVGQAMLLVAQGESARAQKMIESVSDLSRDYVPALLAKACAKFNAGEVKEALRLYRDVFQINPSPPPCVRLGLAYCFAKLGQTQLARKALLRTLQLQEDCVEAMCGLAVLHLNEDRVDEAMELLKRAYELEPDNPSVLSQLASHYFFTQQYDKAHKLANRAFLNSGSPTVRSEACYTIGRCFHAKSDYASALQWYSQATKESPGNISAQFGLGQMYLASDDTPKAVECFETVLKKDPESIDALKALGSLYCLMEDRDVALQRLTKAAEIKPDDVDVWLELAKVQEGQPGALPKALTAYETAASLLKRSKHTIPAELWSNIGALRHHLGKLESAEKAYNYALRVSEKAGFKDAFEPNNITTTFNLALLHEQKGELSIAESRYKGILERHPNYVDCFLRLSSCAAVRGSISEATSWLRRGIDIDGTNADLWTALGNLFMREREYHQAHTCFDRVMSGDSQDKDKKRDVYAITQLATQQLKLSANEKVPEKKERNLDKAAEMYRSVLVHEPNNLFAANGIGVVCVMKGRFHEAREIFTQVREAGCDSVCVMLNLAQLHALQGEKSVAVPLYQKVQKRLHSRSFEVQLLEARAHFEDGKLADCRRAIQKAIHMRPTSMAAWHSLALAYERSVRPSPNKNRSVAAVEQATADLKFARRLCEAISATYSQSTDAAPKRTDAIAIEKLSKARIQETKERCEALVAPLEKELVEARERGEREASMLREAEEKEAALRKEREAKEAEERETRRLADETAARMIREQKERLAEKLGRWEEEEKAKAEADEAKQRDKKRKKSQHHDSDDSDEEGTTNDGAIGRPREEEAAAEDDLFGSDDSDADAAPNKGAAAGEEDSPFGSGVSDTERDRAPKKSKIISKQVDDEDELLDLDDTADAAASSSAATAPNPTKRRKVLVDDDDDDDDDDGKESTVVPGNDIGDEGATAVLDGNSGSQDMEIDAPEAGETQTMGAESTEMDMGASTVPTEGTSEAAAQSS
ncbi:hypothetical protein AB1Y20_005386 [Prymnesium parvum]|uniref:RNA polymerase-associated protein CTR9 homolog n=1 Tax=Prymnesium parvum TaxID=97485 RepID=A0AB34J452_PRYPA